jgi:hypothetical protein
MLLGKAAFETKDIRMLEQKIEKGFYSLPTTFYKEVVGFLIGMLQYDSNIRLSAEELGEHDFLCKNIRKFTRIDIIKMKKYIKDNKLVISVKEDRNLWNIFNYKYDDRFLEIIPEDTEISESAIINKNNNINNNFSVNIGNNIKQNFSINITNNFNITNYNEKKENSIKNHKSSKNLTHNKSKDNINDKNKNRVRNKNMTYNKSTDKINKSTDKINKNNNKINTINNDNDNTNISKEMKEKLKKGFDKMNEDFFYMAPIFIPLIPGNDPKDRFNGEKQI